LLVVLAMAIVFSRAYKLVADPPAWARGDYITDEGWWADGARGRVLFGDYFADDLGAFFLMAPGYTWFLEGLYRVFGVGLLQTRVLACVAGLATLGLSVLVVCRFAHFKVGILVGALLGISPFLWAYSRIAYVEPTQGLFIFLAFATWIALGNVFWGGLLAGASMGIAVAVKANTITIALPALALAAVASVLYQRKVRGDAQPGAVAPIRPGGLLGAALGFSAVGAFVFATVALPHWVQYLRVAIYMSGVKGRSLRDYVTLPGMMVMSEEVIEGEWKVFPWCVARWSPAISVGAWGYVTSWVARWSTQTSEYGRPSPYEVAVTVWTATLLLFIMMTPYQPSRRFVLVLPGLAILAAVYVAKVLTAPRPTPDDGQIGLSFSRALPLWLAATFPLLVVAKPVATSRVMLAASGLAVGSKPGLSDAAAGTIVVFLWLVVAAVPSFWSGATAYVSRAMLSRWPAIAVVPLLVYEMITVGVQLSTGRTSFVEQQRNLKAYAVEGEIVLGGVAASLFLPYRVRTVHRDRALNALNADVWERLHPRYIVEQTWRNFGPEPPQHKDQIELGRYTRIYEFAVGPTRSGVPRHRFELYEDLTRR
jgi:hypothetical protein